MQDSQIPKDEDLILKIKALSDTTQELNNQLQLALKENQLLTLRLKNAEDFQQLVMELHPKKDTNLILILLVTLSSLLGLTSIFWVDY